MHVGMISFCDGVGYNVKSDDDKARISAELSAFGLSVLSRQYERFSVVAGSQTLKAVRTNPHMLSVRTHGNPYFLYLTTVNGVRQCIFIDKKIQQGYFQPRMILTKLWFDASLFSGTILDGEMVRMGPSPSVQHPSPSTSPSVQHPSPSVQHPSPSVQHPSPSVQHPSPSVAGGMGSAARSAEGPIAEGPSWTFVVNDILVDRGMTLANVNLVRRVNRVYDILSGGGFVRDGMDPCAVQVKRYFTYDQLPQLIAFIPTLPYDVRGIVFKSLFLKFRDILLDFRNEADIRQGREEMRARRTKISNEFMLKDPPIPLPVPPGCEESDESGESDESDESGESGEKEKEKEEERTFVVRRTGLPDVYELGANREVACIPSLSVSKAMRVIFAQSGVADGVTMRCRFHCRFKRWVPIVEIGEIPIGA